MNANEYQRLAMRTQADQSVIRDRVHTLGTKVTQLDNASRGLGADVGEVLQCVQKFLEYGQRLDIGNLREEVGDCLWRLAQICDAVGLSLEGCMRTNIAKLQVRYPERYTDKLSANRDYDAELQAMASQDRSYDSKFVATHDNEQPANSEDDGA